MNRKLSLLALFIFVLSACAPSAEVIQTAMVQTQISYTATPQPTYSFPTPTFNPTQLALRQLLQVYLTNQSNSSGASCPDGCTTHVDGCDIKGNISFDSDEKIYHVPGQEFYSNTTISPDFGERWFCTEAEAEANGWRKSSR